MISGPIAKCPDVQCMQMHVALIRVKLQAELAVIWKDQVADNRSALISKDLGGTRVQKNLQSDFPFPWGQQGTMNSREGRRERAVSRVAAIDEHLLCLEVISDESLFCRACSKRDPKFGGMAESKLNANL